MSYFQQLHLKFIKSNVIVLLGKADIFDYSFKKRKQIGKMYLKYINYLRKNGLLTVFFLPL